MIDFVISEEVIYLDGLLNRPIKLYIVFNNKANNPKDPQPYGLLYKGALIWTSSKSLIKTNPLSKALFGLK